MMYAGFGRALISGSAGISTALCHGTDSRLATAMTPVTTGPAPARPAVTLAGVPAARQPVVTLAGVPAARPPAATEKSAAQESAVAQQPAPAAQQPAPVARQPAPVARQPAPVAQQPAGPQEPAARTRRRSRPG